MSVSVTLIFVDTVKKCTWNKNVAEQVGSSGNIFNYLYSFAQNDHLWTYSNLCGNQTTLDTVNEDLHVFLHLLHNLLIFGGTKTIPTYVVEKT